MASFATPIGVERRRESSWREFAWGWIRLVAALAMTTCQHAVDSVAGWDAYSAAPAVSTTPASQPTVSNPGPIEPGRPPISCSSGVPPQDGIGGACPSGTFLEGQCCDTCSESTGVPGSVFRDATGACPDGSVGAGRCCANCSNLGSGAVVVDDGGSCPGMLVRASPACCAPCSDIGGINVPPTDAGACPAGYTMGIAVLWGGRVHPVACCIEEWWLDGGLSDSGSDTVGSSADANSGG
jgi:hypothetical protein